MAGILDYLRPDYPQLVRDASGVRRVYALRGPTATITPLLPDIGDTWLDSNPVSSVGSSQIATSSFSDYTIETYKIDTKATAEKTDEQYPFWEIDQVQVEKSLMQHPSFIGFSAADVAAVTAWDAEADQTLRANFQYWHRDKDGLADGSILTLSGTMSTGQKAYAYLRIRGVESFLDFAPVVRRNSRYIGSAAPDSSDAGQKTTAPSYAPSGYEWLKTADRVSKSGARGVEWIRQEEWTGARKVLLDKDSLFTP